LVSAKKTLAVLALTALGAVGLCADDSWRNTAFDRWSQKDCDRILSNSPWSKSYTAKVPVIVPINRDPFKGGSGSRPGGSIGSTVSTESAEGEGVHEPGLTYTVSFRTAKPVRQAVARLALIQAHYDELSGQEKIAAETRASNFVAAQFPDKIIVDVKYEANTSDDDRKLAEFWQTQTAATLRSTMSLTGPDGDHLAPVDYWVGKGAQREFQVSFPRKPREQAQYDRPLVFEFVNPAGIDRGKRFVLQFNPNEMRFDGAITY
jgi:hypothetical protein